MSEIQRATPEVVRRIEERWAGLLPRVEAKLQTVNGFDRGQEMRLLDQAAQASSVATRVRHQTLQVVDLLEAAA